MKISISEAAGIRREIAALERSVELMRRYERYAPQEVRRYLETVRARIDELSAGLNGLQASIDALPDETQRRVLQCRFDGLTVEQTADKCAYCARSIIRITHAALESIRAAQERTQDEQTARQG